MIYRHTLKITLLTFSIFTVFAAPLEKNLKFPPYEKSWEDSVLFFTKFLEKPETVEKHLTTNYAFEISHFKTPDGLNLECLVRKTKNPTCSFIISAGFFPGLMTGMAALVKMLPENCNIIFYNNRGKGNSDGWWVPRLWDYGTHEYKDAIGAFDYAQHLNKDAPLVLYGTCAGTFANSKALCHLHETNKLKKYNIHAHIMDSTVTHLPTTVERIPTYKCSSSFWGWIQTFFLWGLRYSIFNKYAMTSGDCAQLNPKILAQTGIPTLHYDCAKGDLLTPYASTNEFYKEQLKNMSSELCEKKTFEESSHANHVLKHKKEYAFALASFLNKHVGAAKESV